MIQRLQDMTKSDSNPDIESLPLDDLSTANLNLPDRQEEKDFDFVDDEFEQGKNTANGYALNPALPMDQEKVLRKHGDQIVNQTTKASKPVVSITDLLLTLDKADQPSTKGRDIAEKTESVFKTAAQNTSVLGIVSIVNSIAGPIYKGVTAVSGAFTKWDQWNAYEKAVFVDPSASEKIEKADAGWEAKYALTKVWKGFVRKVKDVFMAISNFVANILILIPGAQIVAGPWKIFNKFVDLVESIYSGAKGIYQYFTGEQKVVNSEILFNKALKGDENALELIINLKLESISGSWEDKEEKWYSISSETKDKVSSGIAGATNKIKGFLGFNKTESGAKRIIDIKGWGSGGPQSTKELHDLLNIFAENADSKKLILSEIKESMTGYGR
jgi:hypothetical protein